MTTPKNDDILEEMEAAVAEEEINDLSTDALVEAKKEIDALNEKMIRIQADQQNMVRRMERERLEMSFYITQGIVSKLLPIVDDMERALGAIPEEIAKNSWTDGMKAIHANTLKQLDNLGVKSFESIGQEVDVTRHEVMSVGPGEKDKIILEFQKGYQLLDQVIRPAKVVVGNGD